MGRRGAMGIGALLVALGIGYWAWLQWASPEAELQDAAKTKAPHRQPNPSVHPSDLKASRVQTKPFKPVAEPPDSGNTEATETGIAGRCVDWNGDPLPGVFIRELRFQNDPARGPGLTGKLLGRSGQDGKFFLVIAVGQVRDPLSLHFEYLSKDRSSLLIRPGMPCTFEVGKIKQLGDVVVGGREYGAVEGKVTESASGEPVAAVDIYLYPRGLGRPLGVRTNSEGVYVVRGLGLQGESAPSFMVTADLASAQPTIKRKWPDLVARKIEPHEHDFVAQPGAVAEANFDILVIPPPPSIKELQIRYEGAAGKDWRLLGHTGQVITFGATILPGGVIKLAKDASYFIDHEPLTLELRDAKAKTVIQLPARINVDVIRAGPDHQVLPTATLSGKVVDQEAKAVAGATVVINKCLLRQPTGMHYAFVRTNASGEYSVALAPGDYWISVKRDAGRVQFPGRATKLHLPMSGAREDLKIGQR